VKLNEPASLGGLADFYASYEPRGGGAYGEATQYTAQEKLELEAEQAWVEIELRGVGATMWRFHMIHEDGRWKACTAELRP